MAEVRIRMARPSLQLPHQTPEAWRKRLEGNDTTFDYALVAEVDGKVVGTAGLHRGRRPRAYHAAGFGMTVHEAYQGQGVGKALMAAAVEAADKWLNLVRIELEVWPDNERAIRLYESFGFEHEGRKRMAGFRDGQYVDSLVMGRIRPGLG